MLVLERDPSDRNRMLVVVGALEMIPVSPNDFE